MGNLNQRAVCHFSQIDGCTNTVATLGDVCSSCLVNCDICDIQTTTFPCGECKGEFCSQHIIQYGLSHVCKRCGINEEGILRQ